MKEPQKNLIIDGPAGALELRVAMRPNARCSVVVCHPHPMHGGTMHNKVVTTAIKAGQNLGMNTVGFNFRGVGESQGEYAHGQGEQDDLRAVIHWLQQNAPGLPLIVVGFSFGSYIAAACAASYKVQGCISIAPAVTRFDFSQVARGDFPWVVLQGSQDEIVDFSSVKSWYSTLSEPKQWIEFEGAGHFFHGHLVALRHALERSMGSMVQL